MKKGKYIIDSSDEANHNTKEFDQNSILKYKQLIESEEEEIEGKEIEKSKENKISLQKSKCKKQSKKQSSVWLYFETIDGKDYCKECKVKWFTSGPSTSNLKDHLEDDHNDIYLKHWKPSVQNQKAHQDKKSFQPQISKFVQKPASFQQEKLNELIAEYIAKNMKPYNTVESKEFINLVQYLEPTSTIPSPYILTYNLIPSLYNRIKQQIIKDITSQNLYGLSITTDIWTAVNNKSFITATIHFIDNNFQGQTRVLSTIEIIDNHTAENMLKKLVQVFDEFKIYYDQSILKIQAGADQVVSQLEQNEEEDFSIFNQQFPLFVTTDQASNNVKAFKSNFKIPHLYCYAHMIHNILEKIKNTKNNEYEDIIQKIRTISKAFRKSQKKFKQLSQIQKMIDINPPLKLKLDIPTRWGSTFDMLERFEVLQKCLQAYQVQYDKDIKELENFSYNKLKDLVQFLQPFRNIIKQLSKRNDNSISKIVKFIQTAQSKYLLVSNDDQEFIKEIKISMNECFIEEMNSSIFKRQERFLYFIATYLHPRTKNLDILSSEQIEETKGFIQYYYQKLFKQFQGQKLKNSTQDNTTTNQTIKYDVFGFEYYEDELDNNKNIQIDEINMYDNHFFQPSFVWQSFQLLDWWKSNQETYPILSKMARIFLNIQITSIESERVFSKAGGIYSNKRSALKSTHANELIFISSNKDLQISKN